MTANKPSVEMQETIERGKATRPWMLHEQTRHELGSIEGMHSQIDTAFVPWGAREPVDEVEVLFTIDERVLERRDRELADVVRDVGNIVEGDPRLDEYVVWDGIEPRTTAARIDDERTRVRVRWATRGENE